MATFTREDMWAVKMDGGNRGRRRVVQGILVLSSEGGTEGDIPASVFGLVKVDKVSDLVTSSNTSVELVPEYDGGGVMSVDPTDVSGVRAAADVTATGRVTVEGY